MHQGITQTAYISKSITIVGGYPAGFGQPADPVQHVTILDAGGSGRVFYINGADDVYLTGLTITNGDATALSGRGGGLYANDSQLTLQQVIVISNTADFGGGLYLRNGEAVIQSSQLLSNTADYGGGLYSQSTGLTITQNEFSANKAAIGGGALRLYTNNATVSENDIVANTAGLHGGGLYVLRGQLFLTENTIAQNEIDNSAQGWGGGLHLTGSSNGLVQNNLFENNRAIYGGGLRLFESVVQVDANVVRGNTADFGGGLAIQGESEAELQNNAIIDNAAAERGAGVYVQESTTAFAYTTLARNAGSGEALVVAGSDSVVTMQNSIFADHVVGVHKLNNNSNVLLESTLWDNNDTQTIGSVANIVAISGNAAFAADGYHLLAGSAAIDAGIDIGITHDIDGYVRPYYNSYDLGADEWSSLIALKIVNQPLVQPNDVITYTFVLQNPLAASVTAVLTDTLPNEVTPAAPPTVSAGTWQVLGQQLTWEGTIPAASEVTIVWPVQVASDLTQGQVISNQATVKDNVGIFTTAPAVAFWPVQLYLPMIQR